jgi:hypothetical protein
MQIRSMLTKNMRTYMSRLEPVSDCYFMQIALSWQEQITFQWDDDVQVVLDQRIFKKYWPQILGSK